VSTTIITRIPPANVTIPVSSSRMDNAIGILLPITQDSSGLYFQQSFTTLDQASTNIKNLVLTIKGERIMHPSLGTKIYNLLMEPMTDFTQMQHIIDNTIRDAVNMWLPYINIDTVTTTFNQNQNMMNISIEFSLRNDPASLATLDIPISLGEK